MYMYTFICLDANGTYTRINYIKFTLILVSMYWHVELRSLFLSLM